MNTAQVLFYIAGLIAGLGWAALIFAPRRIWWTFWFAGVIIPLILGLLYTLVFLLYWNIPPEGTFKGFFSLYGLRSLFENDGLLLAGWIDLLVIPLIVGAWMTRRAAQIKVPHAWMIPILLITLGFPGTGFVLFAVLVAIKGRWKDIAPIEDMPQVDCNPVEVTMPS
jgi:ABA DEFICIENT 4-like